ncbi:hypothetical protein BH09ACT6_BH09ACT6_07670 [soil metagenome]
MPRIPFGAELLTQAIPIAGTFNFRDVGGYGTVDDRVTARRQLFRSDALHGLKDDSRETLSELGLRTVVDLRTDAERVARPDMVGADGPNVVVCAILVDVTLDPPLTTIPDVYDFIVETRGDALVHAVKALAAPGALPAVVHCAAGKDRTGVVIALVLSALGVPDEIVVRDYAATELFLTTEFLTALAGDGARDFDSPMLRADAMHMRELLARIQKDYGGALAYLKAHGLTDAEYHRLRDGLTTTEVG